MEEQIGLSRRRFLKLSAMGAVGAVLAACTTKPGPAPTGAPTDQPNATSQPTKAPTQAAKEPVTLTYWHHFSGPPGELMAQDVEAWNSAHPDIQVKINVVPFDASAAYSEKMTAAAAAGTPPDIFLNPAGAWAVGLDLAIPLDPYMERDNISLDDYYPGAVERVMWEGKAYGIPFNMDTRGIWWNKKLFRDAGLDPETPPKTWDELYAYCERINKKDQQGNLVTIGFIPGFDQASFYSFIYQNGGRVQTFEKEHRPPTLLFDSPEAKEALVFMKKLTDLNGGVDNQNAFLSSFVGGANDPFYMGQLAMMYSGPWRLPDIRKYAPDMEWGLATEPLGPKAKGPCTLVGGFEVSIPKLSKSYEAAWNFLKYLATLEVQIPMSKAAGNTPGHKVPPDHEYLKEDDKVAFFVKAGEWGASFPEAPWSFPLWFAVGQDAVQEVFADVKTVDQALADARVKVQAEIDRWFASHPE